MTRYTAHNPGKHRRCRECGQDKNVSATTDYTEDNYTCDTCCSRMKRKARMSAKAVNKSTQTTANR